MSGPSQLDDVVKEFLVESNEGLDQLDQDLLILEKDPASRETIARIFRSIHTIKGTCGFLGFGKLESVTHVGENLLSKLRDGHLTTTVEITSGLLRLVDAVRGMLGRIETEGTDGDGDYSELIDALTRLLEPAQGGAPTAPKPAAVAPAAAPASADVAAPPPAKPQPTLPAPKAAEKPVVEPPRAAAPAPKPAPRADSLKPAEKKADAPASGRTGPASGGADGEQRAPVVSDSYVRVDVRLLDRLMDLVGELVLARNQILQFTATQENAAFQNTSQRLNLITTELQEGVMKTRMQPIGNVWGKFPRVVRDLAIACGKQVRIEMDGTETELDRTIIEAIKDPLTHIVRNAVDHGIETPGDRMLRGKAAEGRLFMRAFHEGGQVNIEISDDGAGIDPERIKTKARQRGLITPEQADRFSERESINLIFQPGFSTAEKVTNVSGRGVGMDVVKTNIEKVGGTVDIHSRYGHGSTLRIKIPLTLAIIPALIVKSAGERYAIPQVNLLELVRLEGEQSRLGIERIFGAPVYRLRGNLLPIVYLNREFRSGDKEPAKSDDDTVNIVVLQADDRQFGLVVDEISDTQEIVVKPLGKQLKGISIFAGATILGDGRVALILDTLGLAQRANVVSEVRERALGERASEVQQRASDAQAVLLFGIHDDGRMAMPLSTVARLEEFPLSAVERAGGSDVVQYREQILPLIYVSEALPERRRAPRNADYSEEIAARDSIQVVVYSENGRSVGLVVDRILDIVEESLKVQRRASRPGVLGSAVIQNRVTELLDVNAIVRASDPGFFDTGTA